jgi:hypothetical protein
MVSNISKQTKLTLLIVNSDTMSRTPTEQIGSVGKVSDLYSGGTWFEPLPGYLISCLTFTWPSSVDAGKHWDNALNQATAASFNLLPNLLLVILLSRDSSVGLATGYELDNRGVGVWVPVESRIFSSPRRPDRLWGPPNLLSIGYRGLFSPGVKLQWREADHSSPSSAEVKKMWICTSTHLYA